MSTRPGRRLLIHGNFHFPFFLLQFAIRTLQGSWSAPVTRTAALTTALVFAFALTTLADEPLAKTNSAEDAPGQAAVTAEAMKRAVAHFEEKVQPLLAARCFKCHGPDKQKGGLRLDSRAAVLHGGQSGPAVAPHRVQESLLIEAVRYESLEMPPDRPLAKDEVDAVVQWVEQGAVWPAAEARLPCDCRDRLPRMIASSGPFSRSADPTRRPRTHRWGRSMRSCRKNATPITPRRRPRSIAYL